DGICCCQAEDGIRDGSVTGVQTCALPISLRTRLVDGPGPEGELARRIVGAGEERLAAPRAPLDELAATALLRTADAERDRLGCQIGRASCRERGWVCGLGRSSEIEMGDNE